MALKGVLFLIMKPFFKQEQKLCEMRITDCLRKLDAGCCGFEFYEETDSTNLRAVEYLKNGKTPFAIIAAHQTDGKGRFDRSWRDFSGRSICITCGFGLKGVSSEAVEKFSILAGVNVASTLSDYCKCRLKIKWPNDIFFEGRKLGGMIGQCFLEGGKLDSMIFGIGVNFGKINSFDGGNPVSMEECANAEIEINEACALVVNSVFSAFKTLSENPETDICKIFEPFDFLRGKVISVNNFNNVLRGVAAGVDSKGRLLLETESLGTVACGAGETTILKDFK